MNMMTLANALDERGHNVTAITTWSSVKCNKGKQTDKCMRVSPMLHNDTNRTIGINHIGLSDGIQSFRNMMSAQSKAPGGMTMYGQLRKYFKQVETSVPKNSEAVTKIKPFLEKEESKFDVVISSARMSNEMGYYLAHRSNASLILFSTHQQPFPGMNLGMGQPNNPAYVPFIFAQLV